MRLSEEVSEGPRFDVTLNKAGTSPALLTFQPAACIYTDTGCQSSKLGQSDLNSGLCVSRLSATVQRQCAIDPSVTTAFHLQGKRRKLTSRPIICNINASSLLGSQFKVQFLHHANTPISKEPRSLGVLLKRSHGSQEEFAMGRTQSVTRQNLAPPAGVCQLTPSLATFCLVYCPVKTTMNFTAGHICSLVHAASTTMDQLSCHNSIASSPWRISSTCACKGQVRWEMNWHSSERMLLSLTNAVSVTQRTKRIPHRLFVFIIC